MNAINWKKLLLPNIPYLLFVYLFDKVGQAVRLAPGADLSGKVLSLADGFSAAFTNPLPSLARMDLLIGIVGAVLIRLIVYVKGKNAKKYRKGIEYGSARWGTADLNATRVKHGKIAPSTATTEEAAWAMQIIISVQRELGRIEYGSHISREP